MNNLIKEKRKIYLNEKIITPKVIRQLATIFDNTAKELSKSNENLHVNYSLDMEDDSSYESESIIIFDENGHIDNEIIKKIKMNLISFNQSYNIEIQLTHSIKNEEKENYIWVSGSDSVWVNGVLSQFEKVKNQAQSQISSTRKYIYSSLFFISIVIVNVQYYKIFGKYLNQKETNGWIAIIGILGLPIISFPFYFKIDAWLNETFPKMELKTGQEYSQKSHNQRLLLYSIGGAILLGIITSIFYDFIK